MASANLIEVRFFNLFFYLKKYKYFSIILAFVVYFYLLKVGVHMNLNGIFRGLRKGEKKENDFWNTNKQTVDTHARAPQVASGLTWYPSINY